MRSNWYLKTAFYTTLADYAGALLLAASEAVPLGWAGLLILLSLFTWYFAVAMPVMNRAIRSRSTSQRLHYWADVVERFGLIVVCAHSVLFAGMLVVLAV
ncbi:MAG: hypothetical protein ACT4PV_06125 [Planctomycetaceae bacterium]